MARTLPASVRAALLAQETGEALFVLLTISHPTLSQPILCTSDAVDTVSRGLTFQHFPFDVTLADEDQDRPPQAQLKISNVDVRIIEALRAMVDAPTITIELVAASDLETVIAGPYEFLLDDTSADAQMVSGNLVFGPMLSAPYPGWAFTPSVTPGVHQG